MRLVGTAATEEMKSGTKGNNRDRKRRTESRRESLLDCNCHRLALRMPASINNERAKL
ncbi:hypothetical protein GCM10012284_43890 [Mangrovihabitans endophyticus]|uniref:Uncharacterized protein n=1 Tax=Mangrovihabitans endophyticus TaxID=1751298 RepID=A0A8J3FQ52_9ACTN|nr:hypothetical protein GCM10012284_43890 [Mangrovihabitans endophyticus]